VRDKILEVSTQLFVTTGGKSEAEAAVKKNLSKIQSVAQDEVYAEGYHYPVKAQGCAYVF
jgi:stage II sporulation protein R